MSKSPLSLPNHSTGGHSRHLPLPAHPLWILFTFIVSYLLSLAESYSNIVWLPDLMALTLVYWTVHQPRLVGMTIAFICGLLMDVHNGSVLGQQSLSYVVLAYLAFLMHRRLPWFNLVGQALHIFPILLIAQVVVLLIRLWFDGLWPGIPWFFQSLTGAILWPVISLALSFPQRHMRPKEDL